MRNVSRLDVIQTGARRRSTLEEKQRIVAESFSAPRNASATARRYGLSNGQLFTWRRLARDGRLVLDGDVPGFVPAVVVAEEPTGPRASGKPPDFVTRCTCGASAGRIEIVLSGARRVIVDSDVDAAALARVIGVLERP